MSRLNASEVVVLLHSWLLFYTKRLELKVTSDCYSHNICFSVKENLIVIERAENVIVAGENSRNTITITPG